MRNLSKKTYKLALLTSVIFALSGCGGENAYMRESGIIACGDGDDFGLSVAILVQPSTKIEKKTDETTLRVWHYPNKDKMVCAVKGKAEFVEGGEVQY